MRVAFMPHSYFPNVGGAEMATFHLASEFKKNGHQVIVVTEGEHYFKKSIKFPLHDVLDGIGVYRCDFVYPHFFSGLKPTIHFLLCFPITCFRLAVIMLCFRPEVINIQFPWKQAFYCLLVKPLVHCALVVTAQGVRDVDDLPGQPKTRLWQFLRRLVLKQADVLTANSQDLLSKALRIYPKAKGAYCVIPNGVSLDDFYDQDTKLRERAYVLAIGRLHRDKGFDILIHAFSGLASRWPSLDLMIAGDGQEKNALQALIEDLKMQQRIRLVGTVLGEEKRRLFQDSEFVVQPSRLEPFGITVVEAMASGKAIVASRVGGIPEFVEDGRNGFLVPPEDPGVLGATIENLLQSPEKRKQMEINNRRLAKNQYSWKVIAKQYEATFQKVINA